MNADDELLEAFLEESRENLDQFDLDLVALEATPDDAEPITRVFRVLHTLKGTCGFLDLPYLEGLAHAGEDLLAAVRSGELVLTADIITTLLAVGDRIRAVLDLIASEHTEGDDDHADVIERLRVPLRSDSAAAAPEPKPAPSAPLPEPRTSTQALDPAVQHQPPPAPAAPAAPAAPTAPAAPPAPAAPAVPAAPTAPADLGARDDATVRIDVAVLDRLQDLVGELTLARMRLDDDIDDDSPLRLPFTRLTAITRDLQSTVMQARLQPIATATSRLHRVVRDIAAAERKQVRLEITGEDVTVDKAINEMLRDPLMHLVRNAVDHGVEAPEARVAAGKPARATVRVAAALVGGGVRIEVSDDGRGIDGAAVVAKAVEAGVRTTDEVAAMSERQRLELLFLPGVSTAATVTTVSGRGVGMDVVRASLEQIGGSIDVTSVPGEGSSFTISVPLTLAILPALIVQCGSARLTMPQADVVSVVRVPAVEFGDRLRTIGEARFLRYRGELLPLIDGAEYLGLEPVADRGELLDIIVVSKLDHTCGLIVDAVGDSVDAVVKPLPRQIRGLAAYSGATVLADGRPSLILESAAIGAEIRATRAGVVEQVPQPGPTAEEVGLLTVRLAGRRLAVPLAGVRRLERLEGHRIERGGTGDRLQYHGGILPLVDVATRLGWATSEQAASAHDRALVVWRAKPDDVGLVVDAIGDIVTTEVNRLPTPSADSAPAAPGIVGDLVLDGHVTALVDVAWLLAER